MSLAFVANQAMANCPVPVQYVHEFELAPCSGYLFSPEKELEVRLKVDQFNLLEEYSATQADVNEALNKRLQEAHKYNEHLEKRLHQEKRNNEIYNFLYFTLGVLVTGLVAGNVGR